MRNTVWAACAAALYTLVPPSAWAGKTDELAAIRAQLNQMKTHYEQRIAALEARLNTAEKRVETDPSSANASRAAQAAPPEPMRAMPPPVSRRQTASAFNPEISMILSGTYARLSKNPTERRLQGFMPSNGERFPETRSFSLGESEFSIAANIDPVFRGTFRMAVAPDNSINIEEAAIQTLGLGGGVNFKAGRFLSGVGYLNEFHPHEWDFSDAPLPYRAFFGNSLGMDGVQARWLLPSDTFVEFGVEAARARRFPANDEARQKNGGLSGAAFARFGGDVGVSSSWRGGVSYFASQPNERAYTDPLNGINNHFSGKSRTWIADFVWKWAPNGNPAFRYLKMQGEYFARPEKGALTYDSDNTAQSDAYRNRSSGFYAQTVYQFMPRWRTGYRYDQVRSGSAAIGLVQNGALAMTDFPLLERFRPNRHTLMLDYSPSEFSRLRLQFSRDKTRPETTDNQLFLQYIVSLGAHGAHKF